MKKLFTFCAVILSFVAFIAMKTVAEAEFKFTEETHDFGKIPQGTPVTYEFQFTNVGDAPIIISTVEASCGCTVPTYSNTPVKKGEKGTIKATFNAAAAGSFNKVITVKSNAKTPVKYLYIKGEVVAKSSSK
jgi:hypothetical protein